MPKTPMNTKAAAAANEDFYSAHPEMTDHGRHIQIDPKNPAHRAYQQEWNGYYWKRNRALGGKRPSMRRILEEEARKLGTPVKHIKGRAPVSKQEAHLFLATTPALLIEHLWPLRDYYVYMDMDPSDKVDFGKGNPWWTDENGVPHETDGDGRPIRVVPQLAFSWSHAGPSDINGTARSFVMIYDRDRERLEKRKAKIKAGGATKDDCVRRLEILRAEGGTFGVTLNLYVPRYAPVIDVDRCKKLKAECDEALQRAFEARDAIYHKISENHINAAIFHHEALIDAWLEEHLDVKARLVRLDRPEKTVWKTDCALFWKELRALVDRYYDAAMAVKKILDDADKMVLLGQIDIVDEMTADGDHELWRHEFLVHAWCLFAKTPMQDEVFERYLRPLLEGLSAPFTPLRLNCRCARCASFGEHNTSDEPEPSKTKDLRRGSWRATDLKLGTRTAQRIVDLMTKFKDNLGKVIALLPSNALDMQLGAFLFMVRCGAFHSDPNVVEKTAVAIYDAHRRFWASYYDIVLRPSKEWSAKAEELSKKIEAFYAKAGWRGGSGRDFFKAVSSTAQIVGAAAVFYSIWKQLQDGGSIGFRDAARLTEDTMSLARGLIGMAEAGSKGGLEKLLIAKGVEATAAKSTALRLASFSRWFGAVGGAAQLAGSAISLSQAADKGHAKEFWWVFTQSCAADIALAGAAVTAYSGAAAAPEAALMEVLGGIVYLVGAAGELISRPGEVEAFLDANYYLAEEPILDP